MDDIRSSEPIFEPCCLSTTIGSLPHIDVARGTALIFENTPEIPSWVQFPKRTFHENMMVQFTEGMPGLMEEGDRIYFNTEAPDFTERLTDFYNHYLAVSEHGDTAALDYFAISARYAAGFAEFIGRIQEQPAPPVALKGQVTGPFTLGINILDQNGRCAYYDDQLREMIVKAVSMKAMWQITQFSRFGKQAIMLIDEPSLINFGTPMFITISRDDIIRALNEVAGVIHTQGALAGVHCEANTDWSLLMETDLDILVFDAYEHMQAITLYPTQLRSFLERGGCLGWGIVPTLDREAAAKETFPSLIARFDDGLEQLAEKGFGREFLLRRALITPSCGAGGVLTESLAERVLYLLRLIYIHLRSQYGFADM